MTPALQPDDWFTLHEAAAVCRRTPKTIENLLSRHQLPRRLLWIVKQRLRRRRVLLSPATVAYLQKITLYGEDPRSMLKPSK